MELEIKRLSTNRFKINGIVYKRVKSRYSCVGCHFYCADKCIMKTASHCTELQYTEPTKYYHLIPNEL